MSLTKTTIRILPETIRLVKMTDKEYFSSENKDYISNSKLGLINPDEGGSYEKYSFFRHDRSAVLSSVRQGAGDYAGLC